MLEFQAQSVGQGFQVLKQTLRSLFEDSDCHDVSNQTWSLIYSCLQVDPESKSLDKSLESFGGNQ